MTAQQRSEQAAARASGLAMLACEKRAKMAMQRETRATLADLLLTLTGLSATEATTMARIWALSAVGASTRQLRQRIADAVLEARSDARATALARLGIEIANIAAIKDFTPPVPWPSDGAEDVGLADLAASGYAAAWGGSVMRAVLTWADDPSGTPKIQDASDAVDYRLATIAATEVSRAYNDEHAEALDSLAKVADPRWASGLYRRWDAWLDKHTCKVCRAMDGKLSPIGVAFAKGLEPGEVHPSCRCFERLASDDKPVAAVVTKKKRAVSGYAKGRNGLRAPASPLSYAGDGGTSGGGGSSDDY